MATDNWNDCYDHVMGSEGGFQNDPNDKGNWTGCAVGAGQNKGTKYGISACAYPQLDIKNITRDTAKRIYKADYWDPIQGDLLPWGVDLTTFDSGVNSGISRGAKWLQRALVIPADGKVGAQTVAAANTQDPHVTIDRMCDDRMDYLRGLSTWSLYGDGWTDRVAKVRSDAHAMANEHAGEPVQPVVPVPEPEVAETVEIVVRKRAGSTVRVVVREEEL
jgi:lysozyme family protein